jgi:hypothetical protein
MSDGASSVDYEVVASCGLPPSFAPLAERVLFLVLSRGTRRFGAPPFEWVWPALPPGLYRLPSLCVGLPLPYYTYTGFLHRGELCRWERNAEVSREERYLEVNCELATRSRHSQRSLTS